MRTHLLASLFGLSLVACAGQIDGGPIGGDDDVPPADCGNGTVNAGEACDDGNNTDGDGCSASCVSEIVPRLDVTLDKPTVATELLSTNMITATLVASGGFSGTVNVVGTAVDGANAPIPGWIVELSAPTADLAVDGTANIVATLTVPSDSAVLTGSVKLDITSSLGTQTSASTVTALQQVTFNLDILAGECVFPVDATPVNLKVGTVVRFFNKNATTPLVIHSNGSQATGIPHQGPGGGQSPDDPATEPNTAYTRTLLAPDNFDWYCHDPDTNLNQDNPRINIIN